MEVDPKYKKMLTYLLWGLAIVLALIFFLIFVGMLIYTSVEAKSCTYLLMSPGRETLEVEMWPGEGGYKIAKTTGALVIWEEGKPDASIRFGDEAFRGIVGLAYPEIDGICGVVNVQLTEKIFVDYPFERLTEDV